MDTVRESVLKVDSGTLWEKNPMLHWGLKTHISSVLWLFSQMLY